MPPTSVSAPDVKAITVFLASTATATPERSGLPYLDAVLPAEHRLAATRVVRLSSESLSWRPRLHFTPHCLRHTYASLLLQEDGTRT